MTEQAPVAKAYDGTPLNFGDEIPMRCEACHKPHPGFAKTASWARSYVCPCGSSKFIGSATFRHDGVAA